VGLSGILPFLDKRVFDPLLSKNQEESRNALAWPRGASVSAALRLASIRFSGAPPTLFSTPRNRFSSLGGVSKIVKTKTSREARQGFNTAQ